MSLFENVLLGLDLHQVSPEFEPILYAREGTGHPYFDGFFLKSDIKNASPKFQALLYKYKTVADTAPCLLTEGPTFALWHTHKKLMKQCKKENIKYYSVEEYNDYVAKLNKQAEEM